MDFGHVAALTTGPAAWEFPDIMPFLAIKTTSFHVKVVTRDYGVNFFSYSSLLIQNKNQRHRSII